MNTDEKMKQVPFGNSAFQIMAFTANQDTPERSYRNILLQLDAKQKAMKECYFRRQRIEIDLEEIDEKLQTAEGFDRRRLLIDKEEKEFRLDSEVKLIEDCAIEIKVYEKALESLPDFTREEFEQAELSYWKTRLLKQAQLEIKSGNTVSVGTLESLIKIGCDVGKNKQGQFVLLEEEHPEQLGIN